MKQTMLKRAIVLLLTLAMLITGSGMAAFAESIPEGTASDETAVTAAERTEEETAEEVTPSEEAAPTEEATSTEEAAPAEEESPVEEAAPAEETTPAEDKDVPEEKPAAEKEKDEADSAEEVNMPAQTLKATSTNGVNVSVQIDEGTLPEDVSLQVRAVSDRKAVKMGEEVLGKDADIKDAVAVDISFVHLENGKRVTVQPAKEEGVHVKLSLGTALDGDSFIVLHETHDGDVEKIGADTTAKKAEFDGSEFSVYAIVATGDPEGKYYRTYNFYRNEGDTEPLYSQAVTVGDTLADPPMIPGLSETQCLMGWYKSGETAENAKDFDVYKDEWNGVASLSADETYDLYANIVTTHSIIYEDEDGNVLTTVTVEDGKDCPISRNYTPHSGSDVFKGWILDGDGGQLYTTDDTLTSVTSDHVFTPSLNHAYILHFIENDGAGGAAYAPPVTLEEGTDIAPYLPGADKMTRPGYTFDGWYHGSGEDGTATLTGSQVTGGAITEETWLYAKWTPAQSTVSVLVWIQSLDDRYDATEKHYDFSSTYSVVDAAITSETVIADSTSIGGKTIAEYKALYPAAIGDGFTFSTMEIKNPHQYVTDGVSGVGNTTINIYYDREVWTATFRTMAVTTDSYAATPTQYRNTGTAASPTYSLIYYYNGKWYTNASHSSQHNGTRYKIQDEIILTGLYGQPFSKYNYSFPSGDWKNVSYLNSFTGNLYGNSGLGGKKGEITTYNVTRSDNVTVHYWLENADALGTYSEISAVGYVLDRPNGKMNVTSRFAGADNCTAYITSTSASEPSNWGNGTVVTSGPEIGNSNTHVHMRYDLNRNSIRFVVNGETEKTISDVPYSKSLSGYESEAPTVTPPTGSSFTGWYKDEAATEPFDWSGSMPDGDVVVYAGLKQNSYRVVLNTGTDEGEWINGAGSFLVQQGRTPGIGIYSWPGHALIGWYTDENLTHPYTPSAMYDDTEGVDLTYRGSDEWLNGTYLRPGEKDSAGNIMTQEAANAAGLMKLYAKWRTLGKVSITYDANGGSDVPTDDYNYADQAYAAAKTGCTPPSGKTFKCWSYEAADGTGTVNVYPGYLFDIRLAKATGDDENKTITLKAVYGKPDIINPVNVTYHANASSVTPDSETVVYSRNVAFNAPSADEVGFTREGYVLLGWAESADATTVKFAVGDKVAANENQDPPNDLYAVWEEEKTLIFTVDDAAMGSVDKQEVKVSSLDESVSVTATANDRYEFVKWQKDGADIDDAAALTINMPSGGWEDATYTAFFKRSHDHEWEYTVSGATVTATCKNTDGGHPDDEEDTYSVTVVAASDLTYSGSAKAATVTDTGIANTGASVGIVSYSGTTAAGTAFGPSATAPTEAGTYTASVAVTADEHTYTAQASFTIAAADATYTAPTAKEGLTYTGEAQGLVNAGSVTGGTVMYRVGADGEWTSTPPKATDAGSYNVYYYIKGDANHNDIGSESSPEGPVSVSIAAKTIAADDTDLSVSVANAGDYTGEAKEPNVTVTYGNKTLVAGTDYDVEYTNNVNAGTATAKVTLKGNYSGERTANFTIAKADLDVAVSQDDVTYGTAVDPSVTGAPATGTTTTYEYKEAGADDSTYTTTAPTEAGSYVVRATVAGDNYNQEQVTDTFAINAKDIAASDISVSFAQNSITYDGSDHRPTVTVKVPDPANPGQEITLTEGTDFEVTWPDDVKNVGTKTPTITLKGNYSGSSNTESYEITKADAEVTTAPEAVSGLTYNGGDQTLVSPAVAEGGTIKYATSANGTWTDSIPAGKDAGTYVVYCKVEGDGNHNDSAVTGPVNVTIAPKAIEVTADDKSSQYKENLEALTFTVPEGALVGGDSKDSLKITATTTATNTSPAGEYPITLSQGEGANANYAVTLTPGTYTITKLKANVTVANGDATYDGEYHSIAVSVQGPTLGELIGKVFGHDPERAEATVYYSSTTELTADNYKTAGNTTNPTFKDAGNNTVYYYIELANFDSEPADAIKGQSTVNISKAPLTVTAKNKTITYGDAPANDGVAYSGFVNDEDESVLDGTASYTYNYTQYSNVGDYSITPAGLTGANYDITFANGTLTVEPKPVTFIWPSEADSTFVYDGTDKTVKATAVTVNGDELTLTYTDNVKSAKGNYTAKVTAISGEKAGNYVLNANEETASHSWSVTTAQNEITALTIDNKDSWTYGDAEHNVSVTAKFGADTVKYEYLKNNGDNWMSVGSTQPTDAGDYKVVASIAATDDYSAATKEETFTINKASVSTADLTDANKPQANKLDGNKDLVYTGNAQELVSAPAEVPAGYTIEYKQADGTWSTEIPKETNANETGYTVEYRYKGDDNHEDITDANFKLTVPIKKADITPAVTMAGWTYGDTAKDPVVTGNEGNGVVTYEYLKKDGDSWTNMGSNKPADAGEYKVVATVAATENYNGGTAQSGTFTIEPKSINTTPIIGNTSADLTTAEYTYDGTVKKPGANIKVDDTPLVEGTDYTIAYYKASDLNADGTPKEGAQPTDPKDAGDYKAVITFQGNYTGDPIVKDFTIKKADLTPSVSVEGWTYGEEANSPVLTGNDGSGTVTYTYQKKNADGEFENIEGTPSEAGEYKVVASIAETDNYNAATVTSAAFTIAAKTVEANDITVTFPSGNDAPVYDGTEQHPVPVVTVPDPSDPTKTVTLEEGKDFDVVYPTDSTDAGDYEAKIVLKGDYSGSKEDQLYTIAKRPLIVTIEDQTITYGESIDQTKYSAGDPADGQTVSVVLDQSTTDATNGTPGEITATVTVKAGDKDVTANYDITATPAELIINKATLDPEEMPEGSEPVANKLDGNKDLVYTYKYQDLVKAPDSVPAGYEIQYSEDGNTWSTVLPQKRDANENGYTVKYKYVPTDRNHAEVTDDSFTLTVPIMKADLSGEGVVITVDPSTMEFTGSPRTPSVTVTLNGVELPARDYTVSCSNNINKGTATVTVTATAGGSCINSNSTTFSITAKPLTQDDVTVTFPSGDDSPVYDGTEQHPVPVVTVPDPSDPTKTVTLEEGKDYDIVYPEDTVNAGDKTAKIVFRGDYINKDGEEITGIYTVKQAPLTITAKDQTITTDHKFQDGVGMVDTGSNELKNGDQLTSITLTCDPSEDTTPAIGQATEGTITASAAKIMNGEKDVTANYAVIFRPGTLTIKGDQAAPTDEDLEDLINDQKTTSIKINTEPGYEYILTASPDAPEAEDWTTVESAGDNGYYKETGSTSGTYEFRGLTEGVQYYVHARKAATDDNNPSPATTVPTSTRPDAPDDAADCVDVDYVAESLTAKEGYEIFDPAANNGDGAWVTEVEDFTPGGDYQVRIAAKDGIAPSDPVDYKAPSRGTAPEKIKAADIDKSDKDITVHDTVEGQEYIVVPKGTTPTKEDWANAQKGNGGDLVFTTDSEGNDITEGTEYEVITRTSAVAGTSLASNPAAPAEVTTKNSTQPMSNEDKEALGDPWNEDNAEPDSITIDGKKGFEYLVLPKKADGSSYTDEELADLWDNSEKFDKDETRTLNKDSNGDDITANTDYVIIARKAETDTDMPSEPETSDAYTTRPAPEAGEGYTENYPDEKIEVEDGYEIRIVSPEGTEPSDWTEGTEGEDGKNYVPLVPGATYEIRKKADSPNVGDHESEPATFTTAERPETPEPVKESEISKKDTSITVDPTDEAQQYMVLPVKKNADGETVPYTDEELADAWKNAQDGNGGALTFSEDANGDPITENTEYVIYNRVKATDDTPCSEPAASDPVTTKQSQTAPTDDEIKDIVEDQKANSITVNTEPGYEYIVTTSPDAPDADDWSSAPSSGYYKEEGDEAGTHTFTGLNPGTKYYVHVRKAETDEPAPGKAASPANTVETETRNSTPDPVNKDDVKTETKKSKDGKDTSSITIDPTEKGNEYIVVPKGTDPSKYDWTKGKKSENGEAITFDGLTPGKDYEIVTRKAATDPGKESEPSKPTSVTTPKAEQDAPSKPNAKPNGKNSVIVQPAREGEEYSIDGGKTWIKPAAGSDKVVFNGLKPGTSYKVISRMAETDTQKASEPSEAAVVKTEANKAKKDDTNEETNTNTKRSGNNGNTAASTTDTQTFETPAEEPAEEPATENIGDNTVPQTDKTPAAEEPETDDWALFDFILTALTALGAVLALGRRREDDDEELAKKSRVAKGVGIGAAIASIIALILTQDISGAMTLFDGWSILIGALFGGQIASAVLNRKYTDSDEE